MGVGYVDFAAIKERVRIEELTALLGLTMTKKGEQWRGPCPACKAGGERALAVNTGKQSYFCFNTKKGGDVIALASHIQGVSQKDAAHWIDSHARNSSGTVNSVNSAQVPAQRPQPQPVRKGFDAEAYAKTLDPAHAALEPLSLSPDTLSAFKAGYSSSGVNRGRLALPLHDREGTVVCYCGRAIKGESPLLAFPNGINPHDFIFNAHAVTAGDLYLVRDPLEVLSAFENGITNVVAFTAPITAQSLEMLASLMDQRQVELVELF